MNSDTFWIVSARPREANPHVFFIDQKRFSRGSSVVTGPNVDVAAGIEKMQLSQNESHVRNFKKVLRDEADATTGFFLKRGKPLDKLLGFGNCVN